MVSGGTGTWQGSNGNDNWTGASGNTNTPWPTTNSAAIFGGTPGTVTIDRSQGSVDTTAIQFTADGYTVQGDELGLTSVSGPIAIQVGDGTPDTSAYIATIDAVLTGKNLLKTGSGTLILNGDNEQGNTTIEQGVLQVSRDHNIAGSASRLIFDGGTLRTTASFESGREMRVQSSGTILTDPGTTLTLTGFDALFTDDSSGSLVKTGDGTVVVAQDQPFFEGTMTVDAGTVEVNGAVPGTFDVRAGGRLAGIGTVGDTTNAGVIAPGSQNRGTIGRLTVGGNYTGGGGTLEIEAALAGDDSLADQLVVTGDTSGTTDVKVINRGGGGAPTVEGIKVVDVAGSSNGTFTLVGDYTIQGQPAVIAGAYSYTLQKNGASTPTDGDWYLRSSLVPEPPADPCGENGDGQGSADCGVPPPRPPAPGTPGVPSLPTTPRAGPIFQPGVPLYEAYTQSLLGLNGLSTLQQRVGSRYWNDGRPDNAGPDASGTAARRPGALWGRLDMSRSSLSPSHSTSGAETDAGRLTLRAGLDSLFFDGGSGALMGGATIHYGSASTDVRSVYGRGEIATDGYGFGGSLTWLGANGFYVDGQVQATWFDSNLVSTTLRRSLVEGNNAFGYGLGIETGKRIDLGGAWGLTPQVQLMHAAVDFDRFTDPFGAVVTPGRGEGLTGRLGLAADYRKTRKDDAGETVKSSFYGIANLYYAFDGQTDVNVAGIKIASATDQLWGGVGLGGSYNWADQWSVFAQASVNTSLTNPGDSYSYGGTAGLRVAW
ncbi:autotransporter outer membrane beta-barrel domain-containing protein [Chelatococcus sp. GCM10030263]|uniref:autotransporter family protein n=1 Tax=Chelatococcus sp. GCM10030263 TaxID=3273387 RepID=UPI003623A650